MNTFKTIRQVAIITLALGAGLLLKPLANAQDTETPVIGSGDGLLGQYYGNRYLYGMATTNRVDPEINFDFWELVHNGTVAGQPYRQTCQEVLGCGRMDEFGARWTGELQAQLTEPYTLYVDADDGVRVWLNEQLIMHDWDSYYRTNGEVQATVNLVAGQRYLIRIEYY